MPPRQMGTTHGIYMYIYKREKVFMCVCRSTCMYVYCFIDDQTAGLSGQTLYILIPYGPPGVIKKYVFQNTHFLKIPKKGRQFKQLFRIFRVRRAPWRNKNLKISISNEVISS